MSTESLEYPLLKKVEMDAQALLFSIPQRGSPIYEEMNIAPYQEWKFGALINHLIWIRDRAAEASKRVEAIPEDDVSEETPVLKNQTFASDAVSRRLWVNEYRLSTGRNVFKVFEDEEAANQSAKDIAPSTFVQTIHVQFPGEGEGHV